MTSRELKDSIPTNWTKDIGILDFMVEVGRRCFNDKYIPPYKIGGDWLTGFMDRPETERAQEYQFLPNPELINIGLKHTIESALGSAYYAMLYYEDEDDTKQRASHSGIDLNRVSNIRDFVVKALQIIQRNVASLKSNPTRRYEINLLSVCAPTVGETDEMLYKEVSGDELKWHLTKAEDIEQQVKRAVLLQALGFAMGTDNMISTGPNFASRIASENDSIERTMQLYWGWGNPHVFYGLDSVESKGTTNTVTLTDKVIIASGDDIVRKFILFDTFPQDMVYCLPKN